MIEQPLEAPILPDIQRMECNCYLYAKSKIKDLPPTKDIKANSIYPVVGQLVVIEYNNEPHYMVVKEVNENGIWVSECNFTKCTCGDRFMTWEYLKEKKSQYYRTPEK